MLNAAASGSFDVQGSLVGDLYRVGPLDVTGSGTYTTDFAVIGDFISSSRSTWLSGLAVAADTVTLGFRGTVAAVEATAGASTGVKSVQFSASPAAGACQVAYDALGFATITFNAADAVTGAAVLLHPEDDGSAIVAI